MAELAETTTRTSGNRGRDDAAARISFSDVVRAHYRWDVEAFPETEECEQRRLKFVEDLKRFEAKACGVVVEEYWCRKQASGVVLIERSPKKPRFHRLLERLRLWTDVPEYRLYRETDWVMGDLRKLANLLHDCDVLAIKARWGLEGIHQAVVIPWLMAVESHILGFIENDWRQQRAAEASRGLRNGSRNGRVREFVMRRSACERDEAARKRAEEAADRFYDEAHHELSRIEDYYQKAGEKRARIHFVTAMLILGFPLLLGVALLSAVVLSAFGLGLQSDDVKRFYACMAAGAAGATVSVLMRMGRKDGFTIDHELGASGVRRLGMVRPLIGASLGIVISLLAQTSLIPLDDETRSTTPFYIVVAFLAGFSERWARVVLEGAMRTIEPDDGDEQKRAASEQAPDKAPQGSARTEAGAAAG